MIKLFRNIRQNLLLEGKTSKYFKYAIGEIILVVIGILIALSINNWNETRKETNSMHITVNSLIADLKQDSISLNTDMDQINKDLKILDNFKERLSKTTATIDTLRHIAHYEYLPFFNPSNELNRNTIISLLSTANLYYFDENLKAMILSHNTEQLRWLKVMDENVGIFLNSQYAQGQGLGIQSEKSTPNMASAAIKGPLLDQYWNNKEDAELLNTMLNTISGKILMNRILLLAKHTLLDNTNQMLIYLNNFEDEK